MLVAAAALALAAATPSGAPQPDLPEVVIEETIARFYSPRFRACRDHPPPGMSDTDCILEETARWDARLNAAYRASLTSLAAPEAAALKAGQRAWIAYRDSNCSAYADSGSGGTIGRTWTAMCSLKMTAERTLELQDLPPSACGKAQC